MFIDSTRDLPDPLFLKRLRQITTNKEISNIIDILDDEQKSELNDYEKQIVENFFIKLSNKMNPSKRKYDGALLDSILLFCKSYDVSPVFLVTNHKRLKIKLKIKERPDKSIDVNSMDSFF